MVFCALCSQQVDASSYRPALENHHIDISDDSNTEDELNAETPGPIVNVPTDKPAIDDPAIELIVNVPHSFPYLQADTVKNQCPHLQPQMLRHLLGAQIKCFQKTMSADACSHNGRKQQWPHKPAHCHYHRT